MFAPAAVRPAVPRTFLVLLSALSLLTALTIAFVQPAEAVTQPAVHALSTDCSNDDKQIDLSGNFTQILGDVQSNAGIHVSGANNNATGTVTFNGNTDPLPTCEYEEPGANNTGGFDSPASGPPLGDPLFAVPTAGQCTFTFAGAGDTDLASEASVWLDDNTLKSGLYCKTGSGKLQQSKQGIDGIVSFFAHGHIDLSNGSDADYTPVRADGVLTHSLADGPDAITLAGSGTNAANNTFYRGIIYAPNGEAETGGQHITIGCIVAETVKLNGSNHTISGCAFEPPPPQPLAILTKTNNATGPVAPGTSVNFTITFDVTNGPVPSMTIVDQLPTGIGSASAISDDGSYNPGTNRITWNLTNVADNDTLTYTAVVSATAAPGNYVNVATMTQGPCVGDGCDDDSTVVVPPPTVTLTPTLVIDKVANTASITISGPTASQVATPSSVTWTLNYTLTNGPVTVAFISDPIPTGFEFVSATNSGTYNSSTRTITWNLGTLSTSGSVSFVTSVNLATISRTAATVNVATIDSNETAPDTGQDDVTVSVSAELASTGTPGSSSLPNTAFDIGALGPMTLPLALLVLLVLGSLGGFAYANVRSVRRRQR